MLPNPTLQPTVKKLRILPSAELARWVSLGHIAHYQQLKNK